MSEINLGQWESFIQQIRRHLDSDDINNFQNWDIIKNTMIAGVDSIEFFELQHSKYWDLWKGKLNETSMKPNTFNSFPESSTNNMHHAYSLDVMMNYIDSTLSRLGTVVEFGGGYGNMARLFKHCGHSGDYYIYDIPELLRIQKHYLDANGIGDITLKSGLDTIDSINGNSLFIGLWSISETPVNERKRMLENLGFFKCKNIFIAMGDKFYNEDNIKWLYDEIVPILNELGYSHVLQTIKHGNGMYYFMAKISK